MKRLLLPLWLVGAVLYLVSTLLFANAIWFGADDDPKPAAKNVISTSPAYPEVAELPATAQPEQLDPINPAAAGTPHAITVEQTSSEAPALANLPAPVDLEEQPPTADEAPQALARAYPNQAELLKVTSEAIIRNGPSASADIIGTAYAGARVHVASRDAGWTQIVDPSSGNRGWIDSTVLAPLTAAVDTASTENSKQMSEDAGALNDPPLGPGFEIPDENNLSGVPKPSAKAKKQGSKRYYGRRKFALRFRLRRF
jgi:hypothetical protein